MAKMKSIGTLLEVKITTVFTIVGQQMTLKGVDPTMGKTKITDMQSTFEQYGPTLVDPGEVGGTVWYDPTDTTHLKMEADLYAGTIDDWKIIYPDGLTTHANHTFSGFLTKWNPTNFTTDGYMQAEFSIQLTTKPLFTAGS